MYDNEMIWETVQEVRFPMSYSWVAEHKKSHTQNLNESQQRKMKYNYFTEVSLFFYSTVTRLPHLVKVFTIVMAGIRLMHSHAVQLVTSQVLCHWPKNDSPVGKVSTIC